MDGQEQSRVLNNRQDKEKTVYSPLVASALYPEKREESILNTSFMGVYTCYRVVVSALNLEKEYCQLLSNSTAQLVICVVLVNGQLQM